MWPNSQFPADLVIFTEETLNGKLHFLCSDFYVFSCLWEVLSFYYQVESILIVKFTLILNMVPFMVLSDRVYFESTVIGYSKGSSVIDSYHELSVLFFINALPLFLIKKIMVFCLILIESVIKDHAVSNFELSQLLNLIVMSIYYLSIGNVELLIENVIGNYECSFCCAGLYIYC